MLDLVQVMESRRGSDGLTIVPSLSDEEKGHGKEEKFDVTESASAQPEEPQHGRLLPLGRFVMVYACLGLSIFLTSLDQTIGEYSLLCL